MLDLCDHCQHLVYDKVQQALSVYRAIDLPANKHADDWAQSVYKVITLILSIVKFEQELNQWFFEVFPARLLDHAGAFLRGQKAERVDFWLMVLFCANFSIWFLVVDLSGKWGEFLNQASVSREILLSCVLLVMCIFLET